MGDLMTRALLSKMSAFLVLTFMSLPLRAGEAPKVVVTIKPIHSLVARLIAGIGQPQLIVDGSASPHTFTLKPSTARAINEADVFIRVSDTLEPFTRKIVSSLPSAVTVVTLIDAQGVKLFDQRHGGTFEKHVHGHEEANAEGHAEEAEDHDEDGKDGHIWLDPVNAKAIVAASAKAIAKRYPEYAEKLRQNEAAIDADLDALDREIATELKPVRDKPFIVFHDATQYFERHYGLQAAGSITVSPDVAPSAKRLTEVRGKIAALGAVCVFTEPDFQPNLVAAVTEGSRSRAGTLDAEGQLLTSGPDLYDVLLRGLAHNLAACLTAPS